MLSQILQFYEIDDVFKKNFVNLIKFIIIGMVLGLIVGIIANSGSHVIISLNQIQNTFAEFQTIQNFVSLSLYNIGYGGILLLITFIIPYEIIGKIGAICYGFMISRTFYFFRYQHNLLTIAYLLPHGVPEILIAMTVYTYSICYVKNQNRRKYILLYLKLIPLLIISTFIEVFITPQFVLYLINNHIVT